jgi:hypothetical protein
MRNIPIQRAPIECLKRLRGPAHFIAEGHANPHRSVIERKYSFTILH